jgi:hypothetical protein
MEEVRIKQPVTVKTTDEAFFGSLLTGAFYLIVTLPLWVLPVMVSMWVAIFVSGTWNWHPVFVIAAAIVAFCVPVFVVLIVFQVIGRRPAMFVVAARYAVAGWAFATYVMEVDAIWSIVVIAGFAAVGASFGSRIVAKTAPQDVASP